MRPPLAVDSAANEESAFTAADSKIVDTDANKPLRDIDNTTRSYFTAALA